MKPIDSAMWTLVKARVVEQARFASLLGYVNPKWRKRVLHASLRFLEAVCFKDQFAECGCLRAKLDASIALINLPPADTLLPYLEGIPDEHCRRYYSSAVSLLALDCRFPEAEFVSARWLDRVSKLIDAGDIPVKYRNSEAGAEWRLTRARTGLYLPKFYLYQHLFEARSARMIVSRLAEVHRESGAQFDNALLRQRNRSFGLYSPGFEFPWGRGFAGQAGLDIERFDNELEKPVSNRSKCADRENRFPSESN